MTDNKEFGKLVLTTLMEVGTKQGDKIKELQEEIVDIIQRFVEDLGNLPMANDCCIHVEDAIDDLYKKWEKELKKCENIKKP